jgi:N-acetylglucosaminyldiphosphoundecaprenol N-acetyl-beta-D-mannosaminyltransferase
MRINLFGILVSKINLKETGLFLSKYNYEQTGYICLPDLSVIVSAQKDKKLVHILNNSLLTLPDGKPLEFLGKLKGEKGMSTVSGYWLIKQLLQSNLNHYFYGSQQEKTKSLVDKLRIEFPVSKIIGFGSPPLLNLDEIENNATVLNEIERINQLKPDIIWVGISSPKQDYLVYHYSKHLQYGVMIAVGGVFDYLSGSKKISPEWIKQIGFRWLYRLIQEPRRLWKKYFFTIWGMLWLIIRGLFKVTKPHPNSAK